MSSRTIYCTEFCCRSACLGWGGDVAQPFDRPIAGASSDCAAVAPARPRSWLWSSIPSVCLREQVPSLGQFATAPSNQIGFLLSLHLAFTSSPRSLFQGGFNSLFHKPLPYPLNRSRFSRPKLPVSPHHTNFHRLDSCRLSAKSEHGSFDRQHVYQWLCIVSSDCCSSSVRATMYFLTIRLT